MDIDLFFWVSPGAHQTQLKGWCLDRKAWKIQIKEPPVDARASQALLKWCAQSLGCPVSSFLLDKGRSARSKKVVHSCLKCSSQLIEETFKRILIQ